MKKSELFKPETYSICDPMRGLCKSWAVWVNGKIGGRACTAPLFYLRRPKWIKDDDCWVAIVNSVRVDLPKDTHLS